MVMEEDGNKNEDIILSSPFAFEWESNEDQRAPNILQLIRTVIKNLSPGSDLIRFQLPPIFNIPKSHLQYYGEAVYSVNQNMLGRCVEGKSSLERMIHVVAWSISTVRPLPFAAAPFNPILGETHHVSRGSLNVLLEQVSHHPPVSALHATGENSNIDLVWCENFSAKFYGASIDVEVSSKRRLTLQQQGEVYVMNSPNLSVKLFPVFANEWVGNVKIKCEESGLEADLCYRKGSFFGPRGNKRSIKGRIKESSSSKVLYEVAGHWDRTITIKDPNNSELKVIHDAKEAITGLRNPILKNREGMKESESAVVWAKVNRALLARDWERAGEVKRAIEERERELARQRKSRGENWSAKHFDVSYSKANGWACSPKEKYVPPAPIVYSV
ncbi:hypothetical protein Dimus_002397 [Dionaea muscipula]